VKICTEQLRKYSQVYVELPIVLWKTILGKSHNKFFLTETANQLPMELK
jgi:hypothetical protein